MNIDKIIIKGLFGYIDKEIDFKKDITLLVGINGSGKTSILNLISWLVKPSLPHLCVTEFKNIKLFFTFKNDNYSIECKHLKNSLKYVLKKIGSEETFYPLTVKLNIHPSKISDDRNERNNYLERYFGLGPDNKEIKTWEFINKLPNPTVIGLDRNLFSEESEKLYIEESSKGRIYKKGTKSSISPLNRIKDIVNTEYRKSKNAILNLTNGLKNHLMLSAFEGSVTLDALSEGSKIKLTLTQIETAERRVNDYFKKYEQNAYSDKQQEIIKSYFHQLKSITEQYNNTPEKTEVKFLFGLNANQFIKLKKLLREFEKFESESEKISNKINIFLETINYFLKDSSKELLFKEDTSELIFNAIDKNKKILKSNKDIVSLSSGEQQILILFSYLAFNSSDGKLFIIDEPELSLHIKWQEDFLYALEKITPKETQIILATHSPILVGKKKESAVLLLPYNN
jgi:predicted ATPase